MGLRSLPFFKAKKGWQFAGGGLTAEGGGGGTTTDIYSYETVTTNKRGPAGQVIKRKVVRITSPNTNWQIIDLTSLFPDLISIFNVQWIKGVTTNDGGKILSTLFYSSESDRLSFLCGQNILNLNVCCFVKSTNPLEYIEFVVEYY